VGVHESLLDGILGVGCISKDQVRRAEGALLVTANEFLEGADVPAAGVRDECLIVQFSSSRASP
jgi:hypothetical protein